MKKKRPPCRLLPLQYVKERFTGIKIWFSQQQCKSFLFFVIQGVVIFNSPLQTFQGVLAVFFG